MRSSGERLDVHGYIPGLDVLRGLAVGGVVVIQGFAGSIRRDRSAFGFDIRAFDEPGRAPVATTSNSFRAKRDSLPPYAGASPETEASPHE